MQLPSVSLITSLTFLSVSLTTNAASVILSPEADATIYEDATGSTAGGGDDNLFVGTAGNGVVLRSLIQFDIISSIPAGATINSVTLTLTRNMGSPSQEVSIHEVSQGWSEGVTIPTGGLGGGGVGSPSVAGDVTWIHTEFNTSTWTTEGGDFDSTASVVGGSGDTAFSSAGLVADVQGWLDNPTSNFGWILTGDEVNARSATRYGSRTGTGGPQLSIDFTPVPEPGTAMLLGLGACVALRRKRTL